MTHSTHRIYQVDHARLSVYEAGTSNSERILLLHGIPANAQLFRDVLPLLADAGYHAIAPDMPGYGQTRLAEHSDYSLSAVADLYAKWMEQESIAHVWLVGHDLGGAVAQFLAVRYPNLISRLTLGNCPVGDSFPVIAVNLTIGLAKIGLLPFLSKLGVVPNPYMNREVRQGFGDSSKITESMWSEVFWDSKIRSQDGLAEFIKHLKHLRNDASIKIVPELSGISVPVQVLWSDLDRHQPIDKVGRRLLSKLPDNTVFDVVNGAGHFMPLETPESYVQKLVEWAQQK